LKIAGEGPLRKKLETMAGPNIEFLGWVDESRLAELYARCQALIFPGEEDFGIVPLEVQASGRPVIGYGKGGLQETVIPFGGCDNAAGGDPAPTGIFFMEQSSECLIGAVERFEHIRDSFDPAKIRDHAKGFSRERFKSEVEMFVYARLRESRG
jgi:glycosyltransferase involved in cell wall biosynthesis